MFNLLKADLYRTKKSKSLYVVAIVCIVFVLLSALLYRGIELVADTMLSTENVLVGGEAMGEIENMGNALVDSFSSATAFSTTQEILKSDTLIYCLIAIFILVSAVEFSSGTIKNSLTAGINRKNIYLSKFALSCLYTIGYYIIFFVFAILSSMLVYWKGISFSELGQLLFTALRQIPIYIGVIAAGHCFIFATQSTVASVSLFIVTFMLFNTILPMFNMILQWDMNITLLFPLYQCIELTNFEVSNLDYLTIYGSTIFYILTFVWFGYFKFKKAEIK